MTYYAPVLIPALCRYEHFKRCVESLVACTHADKTDLFIALDYPLKESHWDGYRRIEQYIGTIMGFASVNIIKREMNYGAIKNCEIGISEILENHDRFIFSEDDNEFSPNFLDYINKGLDKFENEKNVFAVGGYQFPLEIPVLNEENYYFRRGLSAWGFGSWKKKFQAFNYSHQELIKYSKEMRLVRDIISRSPSHFGMFVDAIRRNKDFYGDLALGLYMAMNKDVCCVHPYVSKVRNHGHDGSGVHCGDASDDIFSKQSIDVQRVFEFLSPVIMEGSVLERELRKYFSVNNISMVKMWLRYLIIRLKY